MSALLENGRMGYNARVEANMNERISIDPNICHDKPVICGTRTPVTVILNALAGGDSFETLQKEYDITAEDIRACIAFAAAEIDQIAYRPVKV
jgi:uncharacterized protein (DUF433 family)